MSREALIEFTILGEVVRVAAVDAETGLEVVVMGPAGASRHELERVAVAKLERALRRARQAGERAEPPRPRGPGRLV